MNVKLLLVFLGFGFSGFAHSESCTFSGAKLARQAYKSGFAFTFSSTEDASCRLSSHKAGGSAASTQANGVCTFDLFSGRDLSSGWSFGHISYAGKHFEIEEAPSHGESSLRIQLLLKPKENGTASFLISEVTIEGDDCDDWKSAF